MVDEALVVRPQQTEPQYSRLCVAARLRRVAGNFEEQVGQLVGLGGEPLAVEVGGGDERHGDGAVEGVFPPCRLGFADGLQQQFDDVLEGYLDPGSAVLRPSSGYPSGGRSR